jgi:hypothetical protein
MDREHAAELDARKVEVDAAIASGAAAQNAPSPA